MPWLKWILYGVLGGMVLIQFVPYGRDHTNPSTTAEPAWDSVETRDLVRRACDDCHSNETTWPWYSNVAPMSWLVQRDVDEGREALNFSEWDRPQEGEDAAETVREGSMPPASYLWTHSDARLTEAELAALADGLTLTLGGESEGGDAGGGEGAEHEDHEEDEDD